MSGKVLFASLSFLFIFSFKNYSPGTPTIQSILILYDRTNHLYNSDSNSPTADSICMEGFSKVISVLNSFPRTALTDSLISESSFKLGILYEVYRDFRKATTSYLYALNYSSNLTEKFRINVFAGAGYYNLNNFDSASYFLLQAGETPDVVGSSEDRVRLYNTLGVLYYDNGNYLQSKNYFTQALRLTEKNNPSDINILYSLQLNTATCFYKLGLYEQALVIYRKMLGYHLFPDPLYMNMGRAQAGLHQYAAALGSFKKVKVAAVPGVLNEMAKTALETGNADSAFTWLSQYQKLKKSLHTNALDDGVNELYAADLDIFHSEPASALRHLQEALILFSGNFSDRDIHKNPASFTGTFAYYRLFEVLVKKAGAWEMEYKKNSRPEDLTSAYDSYQSTINLLSYIERSYEMDDAKILLKQKSGEVYTNALNVCLRLDKLYPKTGYLESAFIISEKNKASVMSAQIRERNFLLSDGPVNDLEAEERNIRFNIARLNARADERMETQALQKINDEKSAYETRLVNLQKKMEDNNRFYQLKYADDFPSVPQLQKSLGSGQALISFYNEPEKIEIFVLTSSSLEHIEMGNELSIHSNIQTWIQNLQSAGTGRHQNTKELKNILYEQLVRPIIGMAGNREEWIIVPDGIFFQLPFESLPSDTDGNLILENHIVSYEFSARFILEDKSSSIKQGSGNEVLSFAPFSQQGADLRLQGMGRLEKLSYSKEEIAGLKGERFEDRQAIKSVFIKNLNHFSIIHLASHAITDLENPSASFIAFFPESGLRSEDFLFLDEIYSLPMDSCKLIVISACEMGRGELVHNEGVMSFARAFLYAGCPSTINTLWKADDHSTSDVIQLFYKYLESGDTKSRALQKAKLEFIRKNPIYRDPAYWSHIVLTGNRSALYKKKQPWIWAVLAISCGMLIFFTIRKRKEKKVDAFHS